LLYSKGREKGEKIGKKLKRRGREGDGREEKTKREGKGEK